MRVFKLILLSIYLKLSLASVGDNLPEFQDCLTQCNSLLSCDGMNIFEKIESSRQNGLTKRNSNKLEIRADLEADNAISSNRAKYTEEDFINNYRLPHLFKNIFNWDCNSDCNYKCQQFITNERELQNQVMVQFYGKWPFLRIFGIQEFFSVLFSAGNFFINYINLFKVLNQFNKNKKQNNDFNMIYKQYVILIVISLAGWLFSMLFHIRDTSVTEALDYFGAACIILSNFNAISVRYFGLYTDGNLFKRKLFQSSLIVILVFHCIKLKLNWNYTYNTTFNMIFGLSALVLWILHSTNVNKQYLQNSHIYNNSIQLLPFETKILTKLNYLSISKTRLIPILPIFLNLWLLIGISFELFDFKPIWRLIDAHSIWHLFTIFPTIIWYDWNIWDIEMLKISNGLNKFH